ncbi:MAG: response regulator [Spartobacteria bacterium]|nr:response regulator [Spartobacteria bacterium]
MKREDITVLFVDDEAHLLKSIERCLIREPFTKCFASSGAAALELLKERPVHVVVSDLKMPGMSGLEFLAQVREIYPDIVRLVLSGNADMSAVVELINRNEVFRYISKPLDKPDELKAALRQSIEFYCIRAERDELTQQLERWKQRLSKELLLAETVQKSILCTDPFFVDDVEIYFDYHSYQHVGGDVFDAFSLPDGRLFLYIGDVAGHGLGPALVASLLKVAMEDVGGNFSDQGLHVVCKEIVHRFLHLIKHSEIYATMLMAVLDPETGALDMMNCGHPKPLIMDAQGVPRTMNLSRGCIPVGWAPANKMALTESSVERVMLRDGDRVVFYTDGLIECRGPDPERLRPPEFLAPFFGAALADERVLQKAQDGLRRMEDAGYDLKDDDSSALVICYKPESNHQLKLHVPVTLEGADNLATRMADTVMQWHGVQMAAPMVRLVVMEYAVNIVKYSGLTASDFFDFEATMGQSVLKIRFFDGGREWNFLSKMEYAAQIPASSETGRGLPIIHNLTCARSVFRRSRTNIAVFLMDLDWLEKGCVSHE